MELGRSSSSPPWNAARSLRDPCRTLDFNNPTPAASGVYSSPGLYHGSLNYDTASKTLPPPTSYIGDGIHQSSLQYPTEPIAHHSYASSNQHSSFPHTNPEHHPVFAQQQSHHSAQPTYDSLLQVKRQLEKNQSYISDGTLLQSLMQSINNKLYTENYSRSYANVNTQQPMVTRTETYQDDYRVPSSANVKIPVNSRRSSSTPKDKVISFPGLANTNVKKLDESLGISEITQSTSSPTPSHIQIDVLPERYNRNPQLTSHLLPQNVDSTESKISNKLLQNANLSIEKLISGKHVTFRNTPDLMCSMTESEVSVEDSRTSANLSWPATEEENVDRKLPTIVERLRVNEFHTHKDQRLAPLKYSTDRSQDNCDEGAKTTYDVQPRTDNYSSNTDAAPALSPDLNATPSNSRILYNKLAAEKEYSTRKNINVGYSSSEHLTLDETLTETNQCIYNINQRCFSSLSHDEINSRDSTITSNQESANSLQFFVLEKRAHKETKKKLSLIESRWAEREQELALALSELERKSLAVEELNDHFKTVLQTVTTAREETNDGNKSSEGQKEMDPHTFSKSPHANFDNDIQHESNIEQRNYALLQEEYSKLQTKFECSCEQFNTLNEEHLELNKRYSVLQSEFSALNKDNQELELKYSDLQHQYESLVNVATDGKENEAQGMLQSHFEESIGENAAAALAGSPDINYASAFQGERDHLQPMRTDASAGDAMSLLELERARTDLLLQHILTLEDELEIAQQQVEALTHQQCPHQEAVFVPRINTGSSSSSSGSDDDFTNNDGRMTVRQP